MYHYLVAIYFILHHTSMGILYKATYAMQTTFVCELWKLQSGPPDQDPRGGAEGVGGEICKSVIT